MGQSIRKIADNSWSGGIGRLDAEKAGKLGVFDDHSGIALNGVEIFFLERVAGLGRNKHFAGQGKGDAGVFGSDGLFGGERFIDADDEFGNVVQPGELRVVHDEAEEFTGVDVAMLALVFAALHIEKGLVKLKKSEAKRDEPLPGLGIVVRGIETGVGRIHFSATCLLSDRQEANSKSRSWKKPAPQPQKVRSEETQQKWNSRIEQKYRILSPRVSDDYSNVLRSTEI
jgi:hypothetical protein